MYWNREIRIKTSFRLEDFEKMKDLEPMDIYYMIIEKINPLDRDILQLMKDPNSKSAKSKFRLKTQDIFVLNEILRDKVVLELTQSGQRNKIPMLDRMIDLEKDRIEKEKKRAQKRLEKAIEAKKQGGKKAK